MKEDRFHAMTIEETFQTFHTSKEGLTNAEAQKRLEKHGKNELPRKKPDSLLKIFISELLDPIIMLLVVAILASISVGEYIDAIAITMIITIDLIMGTVQEKKANSTAEALSNLVKERVKVARDGKEVLVDSTEIVIGDLIYLESGDKISADLRIIESHNFTVDESILTGESIAVEKNNKTLE